MDTNVSVLSDAILLAERIQYADNFIKHVYRTGNPTSQPAKGGKSGPKGAGPMDLDSVRAQGAQSGQAIMPRGK